MRSLFFLLILACLPAQAAEPFVVRSVDIVDRKAVIATVEPVHLLAARARIGGTILSLSVKEGDVVEAGAKVAEVSDQKLALQMQALESRIASQQSQRDQAQLDFDRVAELVKRAVSSQTQLDQARTNLDVANRNLAALQGDRQVIVEQAAEGAVLAPGAGRVLTVPVSTGRVVLPGETIATLAEDKYILRLQLPERHAQSLRAGDPVRIAGRGLADDNPTREGIVRIVYPEIQGGRVIADVDVAGLGDYFVGERTRVYVDTGKRPAILVPAALVYRRAGVNYVKLASGDEIVVQPGEAQDGGTVEILSGLADGDRIVAP
jgi:membrane fusion protein, multidrug efflux system